MFLKVFVCLQGVTGVCRRFGVQGKYLSMYRLYLAGAVLCVCARSIYPSTGGEGIRDCDTQTCTLLPLNVQLYPLYPHTFVTLYDRNYYMLSEKYNHLICFMEMSYTNILEINK